MFMRLSLSAACLALSACATVETQSDPIAASTAIPASILTSELARAYPDAWPEAASPSALTSPATEARITQLLAETTLEQKIGQMIQADIGSITPADLAKYPLGSLLAGGNSGPYGDERASASEWDRMVREFRAVSLAPRADGSPSIPIIFGVDAVHGHNNLPNAAIYPHNIGLGAAHDTDLIQRIGSATAAEVAGSGIGWTFAPTLAVPQDLRWGRAYEGYSSDPAIVADYGRAMVIGLQGELQSDTTLGSTQVAATAKHFLADGGTTGGKDQGDAAISEAELVRIHAAGYPPAVDAGALTVMASFSSWNGVKHHGNRTLLTDVLKGQMGFEGFVVGDWNGHGQVDGCTVTDCPQAVRAGLDMFMAPDSWKGLYETTLSQARDGTISMTRIDDAVRRILRVKIKLGLFESDRGGRSDYSAVGAEAHLALAREAVAKSLVLLKNNGSILPLQAGTNVLVTGSGANSMAMQSGGWTVSWQGTDVTAADFTNGQTIWDALSGAVRDAGGTATLSEDGNFSAKPDVAIVVYGESPYAEFQGDVATLDYQPAGATDLALLKRLKAEGVTVVSVFLSGRPMFTNPEINASDAFVAAWLPGTQAVGIADVLVADVSGKTARDFTGRLSFPWPSGASGSLDNPLFPLGYGLNYASTDNMAVLSEDPGIDMSAALNIDNFFAAGRAQAPWSLSLIDADGMRPIGTVAARSLGGAIEARSVDVAAQEDGKQIVWSADGTLSIDGPPSDVSELAADGAVLAVHWRVDTAPAGPVMLGLGGVIFDVAPLLADMPTGAPAHMRIPLSCFAARGASFAQMQNGLTIKAGSGFAVTLLSAKLENGSQASRCPN